MMVEKAAVGSGRKSGKQQERTRRNQAERGRGEMERGEAVCSLHFVWGRGEVPHTFQVSVSGFTMIRDEVVTQDGARNSVSNGARLGPLEPK